MPDRRTFLITCAGVAVAPAFAHVGAQLAAAEQALPPVALPAASALRIAGWDSAPDSGDDVWVHVNSSWRANWR